MREYSGAKWLWAAAFLSLLIGGATWAVRHGSKGKPEEDHHDAINGLRNSMANGDSPESAAGRIQDYTAKIGSVAASLTPEERKPLLAAQRVFAPLAMHLSAYETALEQFKAAGATAPGTLTSLDEILARIELAKRFRAANRQLLEFYLGLEGAYRVELDKAGLPDALKQSVLGGFSRGANIDINLQIRREDEQIASAGLNMLELLRSEWGAWKLQANGNLVFDHEAAIQMYSGFQTKLQEATTRQQTAQNAFLKRTELLQHKSEHP